jgi:hypothetical protein
MKFGSGSAEAFVPNERNAASKSTMKPVFISLTLLWSRRLHFAGQLDHRIERRLGLAIAIEKERAAAAAPGVGVVRVPKK